MSRFYGSLIESFKLTSYFIDHELLFVCEYRSWGGSDGIKA